MATPAKGLDTTEFYRSMEESERLQVSREEMVWVDRYTPPERSVDVLLSFGCGVQYTPHLMLEAVDVFRTLGLDFAAVAGRQFCCGRPLQRTGSEAAGDRVSAASVARFKSYQPNYLVQWCGACQIQFEDVIRHQAEIDFPVIHTTAFLAQRLEELGDRIPWQREVRARVLMHGHDSHPQQLKDWDSVVKILEMVPGVEVVGAVRDPSQGAPCGTKSVGGASILSEITTAEVRAVQAELEAQADEAGADVVSCIYHLCHREWGKFASDRLPFRQYLSILADALGCGHQDRSQTYWKLGDPDAVIAEARPAWESWGMTAQQARTLAEKFFVPQYAADLPQCPCGGGGNCAALRPIGDEELARGEEIPVLPTAPR